MRRITLSFILSLLVYAGWSQSYSYRYWIDNDVSGAASGSGTGEKQFHVSLSSVSNGFHAIHVQARNSAGVWSSVHTRHFLKTELWAAASACYWIDNDMSTLHNNVATSGVIDIDVANLSVGLHSVHYQTIGADGTPSAVRTRHFLIERGQTGALTAIISIDGGEATSHALNGEDILIDISELAEGTHELKVTLLDADGNMVGEQVKEFKKIAETNKDENVIYPDDAVACRGGQLTLPISMDNVEQIVALQFDLQLPEGVTVASNSDGSLAASLAERANGHSLSVNKVGDNLYRFVSVSMSNNAYTGTEGTLLNVKLRVDESVASGDYEVKVVNTELTTADKEMISSKDCAATLTVCEAEPGDVNGDMKISVTDVQSIIGYILNDRPATFIESAADLNGSNTISVTDAVIVIDKILNQGSVSESRRRNVTAKEPQ